MLNPGPFDNWRNEFLDNWRPQHCRPKVMNEIQDQALNVGPVYILICLDH